MAGTVLLLVAVLAQSVGQPTSSGEGETSNDAKREEESTTERSPSGQANEARSINGAVRRRVALKLQLSAAEISSCEPVLATFVLINTSDAPMRVRRKDLAKVNLYVRENDAEFIRIEDYHFDSFVPSPITLRTREVLVDERWLLVDVQRDDAAFIFNNPGRYQIQARQGARKSDVVALVVRPRGENEREAAQAFARRDFVKSLLDCDADRDVAVLEEFVAKHPHSMYADYVHFMLGRYFWRARYREPEAVEANVTEDEAEREARYGARELRAIRNLSQVSTRTPALRFRSECILLSLVDSSSAKELDTEKLKSEFDKSLNDFSNLPREYDLNVARRRARMIAIRSIDDPRLDRALEVDKQEWHELLASVSRQSGVVLEYDRSRDRGSIDLERREYSLREVMIHLKGNGYWEKSGAGYRLIDDARSDEANEARPKRASK